MSKLVSALGNDATEQRNLFVQRIFTQYHEALFRFLRARLGNETEASDVAQDAYVRLCRQRDLERLRGRERSYLFTIASNLLKDRHRRRTSSAETIVFEEAIRPDFAEEETPQSRLEDKQKVAGVKRAVLTMDPKLRQIFLMRRVRQTPYREIANRLGVSERTVERRMRKALKHLKDELLR